MNTKTNIVLVTLLSLATGAVFAKHGHRSASGPVGTALPGLSVEQEALFLEGREVFERDFTPEEGVGPLFNRTSCVACHGNNATGGDDPEITVNNVLHFGLRDASGRFYELHEIGGPVRQRESIAGEPGAGNCQLQPEDPELLQPFFPGMITSQRHTPPVFGFGLLDAVPDRQILAFQGRKWFKHPSVVGVANWGRELEGLARAQTFTLDTAPRTEVVGAPRVGRFGWKAQTATLFQFSADPFNIELGVTSPFFPRENTPDLNPMPEDCKVATHPVNDHDNQLSLRLYYFQAFLAAPERGPVGRAERRGERIFNAIGCSDCHRKSLRTARDYHAPMPDGSIERIDALSNKVIYPWSDLLLHDLGPDNDDQRQMGGASGRMWRTTPLWGLRLKARMWHDGSISDYDAAIEAHGGEGAWSRGRYQALSESERQQLKAFLNSL